MANASFLWWLIRPSNKYPTLELRVCDSCTSAEEAVAIAALYRCLVRAVARKPEINAGIGPLERAITAENLWQAQRIGTQARFIDASTGAVSSVGDALEAALLLVAEDAAVLNCSVWVARTRGIVIKGSSADRQLATYARAREAGSEAADAMRAVVGMLASETAA